VGGGVGTQYNDPLPSGGVVCLPLYLSLATLWRVAACPAHIHGSTAAIIGRRADRSIQERAGATYRGA